MILFRHIIKQFQNRHWYLRFRYHKFIYQLWLLWRKDVKKKNEAQAQFYAKSIPQNCSLIFDVGANEGVLTNVFSAHSQRVVAIEPAERNVNILRAKFFNHTNVFILPIAVSNSDGEQVWYEDTDDYATGTLSRKWTDSKAKNGSKKLLQIRVETRTADSLIQEYGLPGYMKIDVEGSELLVLQGLSQQVALLSFEAILPQFTEETFLCIERLYFLSPESVFNYALHDEMKYENYVEKEKLLTDIKEITQTIDIWCRM